MLQPMRTKFRKAHKGRIKGLATSGVDLAFGQFGLKALEPERVTARQIEAARRALTRHMKRAGRVWIRIYPDVPVSKKPLEVRMGSGKGAPELWVARVKPGRILFEIDGVSVVTAREALTLAAAKLPGVGPMEKITGANVQEFYPHIFGRTGLIYIQDYWFRGTDGPDRPTGDHIDVWNGYRSSAKWLMEWFSWLGYYSNYAGAREMWFWEVK